MLDDLYNEAKDKVVSTVRDIAAKGTTIYNTKPAHSANLDIAGMAEDSAQRQGRGSPVSKSPLSTTMTPQIKNGGK